MKQHKNLLVFLLIILLVLIGLQVSGVRDKAFQPKEVGPRLEHHSIEPAEITEPLKTWYLGAAAFDVPESLARAVFKVEFRPNGPVTLEFTEQEAPLPSGDNKDPAVNPPMPDDRFEMSTIINPETKKLGQEDVSSIVGRPAGLSVYFYSQPPLLKSLSPEEGDKHVLRLSAVVRQDEGLLLFTRTEQLDQSEAPDYAGEFVQRRKDSFLKWLAGFVTIYHWTGRNEPPAADQLATRFGYIDVNGGWPEPVMEFYALFFFALGFERGLDSFFLTARHIQDLSSPGLPRPDLLPVHNYIFSTPEGDNISIGEERRKSLNLGGQASVLSRLNLKAFPPKEEKTYQSYIFGVFYTVFESIRLSGESRPD